MTRTSPRILRLGVDVEGEIEDDASPGLDILEVFVSCLAAGEPTRLVSAPRDDTVVRASARALSSGQGLADHQLVVVRMNAFGYQVQITQAA